ncbi:MAG TPA: hypothetical protein PLD54_05145, partial [Candidatus Levybacteria bacterium]|nr:hypothetical protein [Candidatus Levybacteria bacterium]
MKHSMVHPVQKRSLSLKQISKKYSVLISVFTFVAVIGVTFAVVNSQRSLDDRSKAAAGDSNNIYFTNDAGAPITEIQSPFVSVTLTSPWPKVALENVDQDVAGVQSVQGTATATYRVNSSGDDANVDGSKLLTSSKTVWMGSDNSWTAYRFNNVSIPQGAKIDSAKLRVHSAASQWRPMSFTLFAQDIGNSLPFAITSQSSQASLTSNSVTHSSLSRWNSNSWYTLDEMNNVVQEVVNRSDWNNGNSMSILLQGSGFGWSRKSVTSFDQSQSLAPQLVVTYTVSGTTPPQPTSTQAPIATATRIPNTPTRTPSPLPPTATKTPPTITQTIPSATRTPLPTNTTVPTIAPHTTQVELAEDAQFTVNKKIIPYTTHPLKAGYTFSNSEPGRKTVYARFTSSTGETRVFSNWIDFVVNAPTTTPPPHHGGGAQDESMALNQWQPGAKNAPNPKYDKCDDGTDVSLAHKEYYVVAYDGKKYPTWHPPVVTNPITGNGKCYFGHEHGSDPQKYV